jgi:hypothetical protein
MTKQKPRARTPAISLPVVAIPAYVERSWTGSNTNLRKASCISTFGLPTKLNFAGGLAHAWRSRKPTSAAGNPEILSNFAAPLAASETGAADAPQHRARLQLSPG